jgi:hypothetical protein
MHIIFWVIERALVGACIFGLVQFFLSLAALFRLLPLLLRAFRLGLRGLLILSFRLYYLILSQLAPPIERQLGIDVLAGIPRVAATILLSLLLGCLLLLVVGANVTGWAIALFLVHGLFVGLTWDDIEAPGGIQLGVRI